MIPVSATKVAKHLGGERVLRRRVTNYEVLRQAVESGLPFEATDSVLDALPLAERDRLRRELPAGENGRLSSSGSEKLERVARILALAEQTFGAPKPAIQFLTSRNRNIGNETPLSRTFTELGARQVEELLVRIAYGFPS